MRLVKKVHSDQYITLSLLLVSMLRSENHLRSGNVRSQLKAHTANIDASLVLFFY